MKKSFLRFQDWGLKAAQARGDWDGTKKLMSVGQDAIIEEVKSAENVLARVETDDGVVGWGGAGAAPTMTGETVASMAAAIMPLD